MKILILHQHFRTPQDGGAIRSYYLAKALADKGSDVVVITGYNGDQTKKEIIEGIEVYYLPVPYDNRYGFWKRGISFIKYMWRSYSAASKIGSIDWCYAISVPLTVGITARWISWKKKIPYIFEVGDLWPDAPVQLGFIKNYFLKKFLYSIEYSIYKHAHSIVALSPAIKDAIETKISGKLIHLIPNMADTEFYKPEKKDERLEKKFGVEKKFVISYIGALGFANGLNFFLSAAEMCQNKFPNVRFILCGDGAMGDELVKITHEKTLKNVSILPFQKRDGVKEVMNITDAAFICYQQVAILETGSPNKYFDGLAAGKVILINFGGWIKEEIEREKCGFHVSTPEQIIPIVDTLTHSPATLVEIQSAARLLAEKKYSRILLSQKFNVVFEN